MPSSGDPAVDAAYEAFMRSSSPRQRTASPAPSGAAVEFVDPTYHPQDPDGPDVDPRDYRGNLDIRSLPRPKSGPGGVDVSILAAYPRASLTPEQRNAVDEWTAELKKPKPKAQGIYEGYDVSVPPYGLKTRVGLKPLAESVMNMDFYKGFDVPVPGGRAKVGLKPLADSVRSQTRELASEAADLVAQFPSMEVEAPYLMKSLTGPTEDPYARPTVDLGVAANFLSGTPGTALASVADLGGEMVAQELESAPLTALLGPAAGLAGQGLRGAGRGAKAGIEALGGGQVLKDAGEFFQHRGGMTPASKATYANFDLANNKTQQMANDVREALTVAPTGRAYTMEEQQFLGQLLEQPGQREALQAINETAQDISPAAMREYRASTMNVPGVVGAKGIARKAPLPDSDIPLKDFAQTANDVAKLAGATGQQLVKTFGKDPTEWSRFTELNYNPRMYAGSTMGTFPSRGIRERTGFFKTRSAQMDEARKMQGLITEPGGPMSMKLAAEQRAINTRNLFTELSSDPLVTVMPIDNADIMMPPGQVRTMPNGVQYMKMGDDESLGPLKGMLVKTQEAAEVNALIRRPDSAERLTREWWQAWKFGKTVMSPKTHVRNMVGNVLLAHADGLSPYRVDIYSEALRDIRNGSGPFWKEAKEAGAGWTVKRGSSLDDVLQDADLKDADSVYEAWARAFPRWMTHNKTSKVMAEAYSDSESMFKQALYIYKRRNGVPITQALNEADAAILNYANMPNWVKQSRSQPFSNGLPGIPFISFAYGVTPIVAKTLEKNPRIFQHYKIFADSWNAVAAEAAEATPDEMNAIMTLYPDSIPMISPTRDAMGKLHAWDAARSTPVSQIPSMMDPMSYLMSNPVVGEIGTQLSGYDPFRQQQVFDPAVPGGQAAMDFLGLSEDPQVQDILMDEPGRQRRSSRLGHAFRTAAPSPVNDLLNILGATGEQNMLGTPFDKSDASFAAMFGAPRNVTDDMVRAAMKVSKLKEQGTKAQKKKVKDGK